MKRVTFWRWLPRLFSEYLYPARCVCCRNNKPMGAGTSEYVMMADPDGVCRQCFCSLCYRDFLKSCDVVCKRCLRKYSECECVPDALFDAGVRRAYACFCYEKGKGGSAASRLIYSIKGTENRDTVNFAAYLLKNRILKSGIWNGELSDVILTYAPRGRENVRKYGGDHMKMTATLLAKLLGCECANLFVNGSRGEQKNKGADERTESAAESLRLKRKTDLHGKRVIIIDDIITSGATLSVCAALVRAAGVCDVAVFALAKTRR